MRADRDLATASDSALDDVVAGAAAIVHLAGRAHVLRETAPRSAGALSRRQRRRDRAHGGSRRPRGRAALRASRARSRFTANRRVRAGRFAPTIALVPQRCVRAKQAECRATARGDRDGNFARRRRAAAAARLRAARQGQFPDAARRRRARRRCRSAAIAQPARSPLRRQSRAGDRRAARCARAPSERVARRRRRGRSPRPSSCAALRSRWASPAGAQRAGGARRVLAARVTGRGALLRAHGGSLEVDASPLARRIGPPFVHARPGSRGDRAPGGGSGTRSNQVHARAACVRALAGRRSIIEPAQRKPAMTVRASGPARRRVAPAPHHPPLHEARRRLGADRGRRHAGAVHGQRRGRRAAVPQGQGAAAGSPPSTECCRARRTRAARREAADGKQSGRTQEIQRLIGRSLRAVDRSRARSASARSSIDCDVLQADGGTRCASITGACVALADAIAWCRARRSRRSASRCAISSPRCRSASSAARRCSISTTPRIRRATPT